LVKTAKEIARPEKKATTADTGSAIGNRMTNETAPTANMLFLNGERDLKEDRNLDIALFSLSVLKG
jgi:hypothetical protein